MEQVDVQSKAQFKQLITLTKQPVTKIAKLYEDLTNLEWKEELVSNYLSDLESSLQEILEQFQSIYVQ